MLFRLVKKLKGFSYVNKINREEHLSDPILIHDLYVHSIRAFY